MDLAATSAQVSDHYVFLEHMHAAPNVGLDVGVVEAADPLARFQFCLAWISTEGNSTNGGR